MWFFLDRPALIMLAGMTLAWTLSAPAAAQNWTAAVVSTSHIQGETISCGCATQDLGGIARRATVLGEVRDRHPSVLVVDAGNFGADSGFKPWMRTRFQWDMMGKLGYDVVTPGPSEMLNGLEALKELLATNPDIQVVSANVTDKSGSPIWPPYVLVEKGGVVYGVTGATERSYYSFNKTRKLMKTDDFDFKEVLPSLNAVLPELREKADVVTVLLHAGTGDARRVLKKLQGADVLVVGHSPGYKFVPEKIDQTLLVRAGSLGQYVSVVELSLAEENGIVDSKGETRALGVAVAEEEGIKTLVTRFNREYDALKTAMGDKADN
jgi:2',3'-cyclic-nucleotide 2'-phosphodiesterase (5'-nucleotidase family)